MNDTNPATAVTPPAGRFGYWRTIVFIALCMLLAGNVLVPLWRNPPVPGPKSFDAGVQKDKGFADVVGQIDAAFEKEWQAANVRPTPAAPPLTVARRLSLGLTGTLPSLEEIRVLEQQP